MLIIKLKTFYFQKKFIFDLFLSKIFYKNLAGFKLNREGFKRWREHERQFQKQKVNKSAKSNQFPLGYHLFQLENQALLDNIIKKYNQVINLPEHAFIYNQNNQIVSPENGKFFMLKNILNSIPEVLGLLDQDVLEKLYSYYGCHFLITHIAAYRTTYLPESEDASEVYAYKLHYDRHPSNTLKLFVNLSNVTLQDGPLNFFDRRNSRKVLKAGYKERDNYGNAQALIDDHDQKVILTGKPGTAAIVDTTSCLHKAGIPELNRTRDLLIFNFETAPFPLNLTSEITREQIRKNIDREYNMAR